MINKPLIEEIRERIPISSFIGERVTLKKAGRNFKGLCPFHSEKTSSFIVSDEKQIFHCFGCGEGGDVFRFLMKFDNISFIEAVKQLASLAGITIPEDNKFARREDAELEKKRELFFRLNKVAAEFFSKNLESGESSDKVRKYLNERGIKTEFFKQLLLGATDNNWEALTTELKRIKAPLDMAAELGLIRVRANGTYYDFFRSRLIFPIVSQRGEIIGFGGRALEDGEDAKYINSPDSIIYNKSSSVYGLESAHRDIRLKDAVILVEGYFDVVSLKLSGIENVVAPLGTAITVSHLRLLSRFSKNMILIFDGDDAGVNAALRSLPLFVEQKLIPKAVLLPRGEDPDTMIQKEGKEKFLHRIESAVTLFEFFIDRIASKCGKDTSAKVEAVTKVGKLYNLLTDPVEKSIYRKRLSQALGLDENVVGERLGDSRGRIEIRSFEKRKIVESSPISAERLLIESLLRDTGKMRDVFSQIEVETFQDEWCRNIASIMQGVSEKNEKSTLTDLLDEVENEELIGEIRDLAFGEEWDEEELTGVIVDCMEIMKKRPEKEHLNMISKKLKEAQESGDHELVLSLLKEKSFLKRQSLTN